MATTCYLESTGAVPITPAVDAAWDVSSGLVRYPGSIGTKAGSTLATVSHEDNDLNDLDITIAQWIIGPIGAGDVTGDFELRMRCKEEGVNSNIFLTCVVRVIAPDGSTVRGTALALTRDNTEMDNNSIRTRRLTAALTTVAATNGDYVVVDVGAGGDPALSGHGYDLRIGSSSASDLSTDENGTTDNNPFLLFSTDLPAFAPPPTGTSALSLPFLSVAATGTAGQFFEATGALSLPFPSLAATGQHRQIGTSALALPMLSLAGAGTMQPEGTSALSLPFLALAGSGAQRHIATGSLSLPFLAVAGSGAQAFVGSGALSLPFLSLVGVGAHPYTGTGALSLPFLALAGSGAQRHIGTGSLSLPFLAVEGDGTSVLLYTGMGAFSLPFPVFAAMGYHKGKTGQMGGMARLRRPQMGGRARVHTIKGQPL